MEKKTLDFKNFQQVQSSIKSLQDFLIARTKKAKSALDKDPTNKKLLEKYQLLFDEYQIFNSMMNLLIKLWDENQIMKSTLESDALGYDDMLWDKPYTPPDKMN